jgi:hypothetical protein
MPHCEKPWMNRWAAHRVARLGRMQLDAAAPVNLVVLQHVRTLC